MTERRPGMDHAHYAYQAAPSRAAAVWPGGARVAFGVVLHLEHWLAQPPQGSLKDPRYVGEFGSFTPDYRTYSYRDHGNRVGVFRILELLDRLRLPVSVALNAALPAHAPQLVQEILRRDWNILGHAHCANQMLHSGMPLDAQRELIAQSLAILQRTTGRPIRGWRSQDFGNSALTPSLLAEAGLDFVVDWPNDDAPYWLTTQPPLVSIPAQAEFDDVELLWHRRMPLARYPELLRQALDVLTAEPGPGKSFMLGLHPWVTGAAHRFRYLEAALEGVAARTDLWFANAQQIADAYRGQVAPGG